ncbi:TPA: hypothetical protein ACPZF0_004418, partial [Yersinia enterocolitica]
MNNIEELKKAALDGVSDEMLLGGWTAKGISDYAKSLETNNFDLVVRLEAAHKRIAELDNSESQLINERDHAESTINSMFVAVMSEKPEWSNMYQFIDAVDEVEDFVSILKHRAESAEAELSAANEKLSKPVVEEMEYCEWPNIDHDDSYVNGWNDCVS